MYFPYFRGKQYELVVIRECAAILARAGFTPVLEPVKEDKRGLLKTVEAIAEANAPLILVLNPKHGSIQDSPRFMESFVDNELADFQMVQLGVLLTQGANI